MPEITEHGFNWPLYLKLRETRVALGLPVENLMVDVTNDLVLPGEYYYNVSDGDIYEVDSITKSWCGSWVNEITLISGAGVVSTHCHSYPGDGVHETRENTQAIDDFNRCFLKQIRYNNK